ncbi:MAG: TonB-dependent receptor, partial [Pseudomonadota bacterium]
MSGSVVAASLFASTALAIAKLPDLDNSASFPPPMLHLAQTARFYTVKIAPGSLNDALVQLGEQTGLRISFDTQTVDGLTTAGLTGRLTSRRALTLLLRSTGLRARRLSGAGVVIVPPPVTVAQAVELPGIIVIGDKEQRSVFDTVNSVGVAASEDIDNSTVFSTNDVLNQIPNVTTYNGGEDISIRGVRADSPSGRNEATSAPVITVYRDGVPLSEFGRAVGPQSLWDVAQIEVLRGSQSTEQGRNSLGGAVYIKTNDPVFTNQTATRFGAGTQGTIVASAMANGVIVPGVLAVRL